MISTRLLQGGWLLISWLAVASGSSVAQPARAPPAEAPAALPTPAPAGAAAEFMAAMQRVRMNSSAPEPPDSAALKAYPIYDYLVAARLRRDLTFTPNEDLDAVIDAFLRGHEGQLVSRALRRQWLASLAQRRRWDWFLPRSAELTDPVLICDRLEGRLETGDTDRLAAEALARWSLMQRPPAECATVFAWLHVQRAVTPALQEARARGALAADNISLAREFLAEVPADRAAPLREWLQLLESPRPALTALSETPGMAVEPDALLAGFTRLSNTDSASAAALLPALLSRPDMTPPQRERLWRAFALGSAYARQPDAVAAFERLSGEVVDAQVQEWRVRAALWSGNYAKALDWIQAMPESLATQPRWRYWRARATESLKGTDGAAALYAEIAGMRDYYGYLAADRLHRHYDLNIHPTADDVQLQAVLAAEPALIRAHELFDCDLADDAAAEWGSVMAAAAKPVKVQAAHMAARWGWYAETIATLAQADDWDDVALRYPRPYAAVVAGASKLTQVPADWILAIMRQESLFRKDAVSRADARGLMQMEPATAIAVARRWHFSAPTRDALFDPSVAIPLGSAYMRELLDRYGNQLDLSLAAYNAGPISVARWLPSQPVDADVWIENIPYAETRGYVQHIFEHIVTFAALRDADPPRLSSLMAPVTSAVGAAPNIPPAGVRYH
ncbi:MAG TPA: transglycosylase SLT domain-containing protein [Steroidobacteraceae bacterium]|nr:transglycosylase SLT domain-containing protein [Steroidobacteraceae bacterium]